MNHDVKILPQYYCRVADGSKTFEFRNNDRGYQSGDTIVLREWNPEINEDDNDPMGDSMNTPIGYTGKWLTFEIGYVLPVGDGNLVFSLLNQVREVRTHVMDCYSRGVTSKASILIGRASCRERW